MYRKILVALDNSAADEGLLQHVAALAKAVGAELLLMHVSSGFAARYYQSLTLAESDEMKATQAYLDGVADQLRGQGLTVSTYHGLGDPPREILKAVATEQCDLIALGGHGHRFLADLFLGSTADSVRHATSVPILIIGPPRRARGIPDAGGASGGPDTSER